MALYSRAILTTGMYVGALWLLLRWCTEDRQSGGWSPLGRFGAILLRHPIAPDLIVATESGPVIGQHHPTLLTRSFMGIPYADPPTGEGRFAPPRPYSTPWGGIGEGGNGSWGIPRPAFLAPPACPQVGTLRMDEDCLYLNIYTPAGEARVEPHQGRPVLFWVHGGAFVVGSGHTDGVYDGNGLAERTGAVVVTINYRLGILGFLATEEGSNGGLADQRMALAWVRRNIGHFGGDPDRVTMWGESAGATSLLLHMTSPTLQEGEIYAGIAQSPPIGAYTRTLEEALEIGKGLARNVSCLVEESRGSARPGPGPRTGKVDMACLRALSIPQILLAQRGEHTDVNRARLLSDVFWWWPNMDGALVGAEPGKTLMTGRGRDIPLLIGTNRDETGLFAIKNDIPLASGLLGLRRRFTQEGYEAELRRVFGPSADRVMEMYPSSEEKRDNERALVSLTTDYLFLCPAVAIAREHGKGGAGGLHGASKSWMYQFTQVPSYAAFLGRCGDDYVCHALELPYLWRPRMPLLLPEEKRLSNRMIRHWAHFAAKGQGRWAGAEEGAWIELGDMVRVHEEVPREEFCRFWTDDLGYRW